MEALDNAGVYRLGPDLAVIQTVDFFTPVVDDPYTFGQIAVANSLSDVYAMGGRPILAMNIVCFPIKTMDVSILKEILRGGIDKMFEAGTVLMGGHSVEDTELKYGLSVTGTIHPRNLITNSGARPGDRLVLTKPLGTGILSTALKACLLDDPSIKKLVSSMAALNNKASQIMLTYKMHSCTDITGFGLIGHAMQMAKNSNVGLAFYPESLPLLPGVVELAKDEIVPGGLNRNRQFYAGSVTFDNSVPEYIRTILYDPQTSGGLLMSIPGEKAYQLVEKLHSAGVSDAAVVGEVLSEPEGKILVRPA